jgi:hypothetical protein
MIITGVTERVPERLAQSMYLDANVPADGENSYDARSATDERRLAGLVPRRPGLSELPCRPLPTVGGRPVAEGARVGGQRREWEGSLRDRRCGRPGGTFDTGPAAPTATSGTLGPGCPNHHQISNLDGRWSRGFVHGRLVAAGRRGPGLPRARPWRSGAAAGGHDLAARFQLVARG